MIIKLRGIKYELFMSDEDVLCKRHGQAPFAYNTFDLDDLKLLLDRKEVVDD